MENRIGVYGFTFIRPLKSKIAEVNGNENIYYVALISKPKKIDKISDTPWGATGWNPCCCRQTTKLYNKNEISKVPRHLRRGGEYGHDPVKAIDISNNTTYITNEKFKKERKKYINLCKVYGLKIIYV